MLRPIGIFDSGIGGLTVARAVKDHLPQEAIVYFGDTLHLPYGDKSTAEIQAYALRICDLLLQARCKVIVVACNSVAAVASEAIHAHIGQRAFIHNVIDPLVTYIARKFQGRTVGLIGTQQTVKSRVYEKKLQALHAAVQLKMLATPLLVPISEAVFHKSLSSSQAIIHRYLQHTCLQDIEALILGCTHYSVLKENIQDFYSRRIAVVDANTLTAKSLQGFLAEKELLNTRPTSTKDYFMVSSMTKEFSKALHFLFGKEAQLVELGR